MRWPWISRRAHEDALGAAHREYSRLRLVDQLERTTDMVSVARSARQLTKRLAVARLEGRAESHELDADYLEKNDGAPGARRTAASMSAPAHRVVADELRDAARDIGVLE